MQEVDMRIDFLNSKISNRLVQSPRVSLRSAVHALSLPKTSLLGLDPTVVPPGAHFNKRQPKIAVAISIAVVRTFTTGFCDTKYSGIPSTGSLSTSQGFYGLRGHSSPNGAWWHDCLGHRAPGGLNARHVPMAASRGGVDG